MYKDVGKEIKEIAKSYVWGKAIRYALVGLAISIAVLVMGGMETGYEFILALIAPGIGGIIGYSAGRREALLFYAYGEVVDRIISLERKLSGSCDRQVKQPKKAVVNPVGNLVIEEEIPSNQAHKDDYEGMPKAVRMKDGSWQCLWCDDYINPANAKSCKKCGRVHEFE